MKTRLKKGEDFVSTFSYPTWEQLPELDLYLDQVLLYVNKTCAPVLSSSDKGLTAAMINNYVKHGSACQTVQLYLETLSYIQPVKTEEETDELHHETK